MGTVFTFGSTFAGIEGFGAGFEAAGMKCLWQIEKEPDCRSVLARHFPHAERFDDVRDVGRHNLKPVDIITGGFPCQDLSVAGKRAGLSGERSGLFYELVRITDELRPMFLVWENVPGLISSDDGRDFARVLRALDDIGYSGAWTGLDAQWFGVAQRRRRIFGVFARGDIGAARCAEILSLGSRLRRDTPTRRKAGERVADHLTVGANQYSGFNGEPVECRVAHTLKAAGHDASEDGMGRGVPLVVGSISGGAHPGGHNGQDDANVIAVKIDNTQSNGWGVLEDGTSHTLGGSTDAVAFTQNTRDEVRIINGDGEITGALAAEPGMKQQNYLAFIERRRNGGRTVETQEDIAYALTNPGDGGRSDSRQIASSMGVRRLTPRECERLQGFPDDWTLYGADGEVISDSARYRMLGNAVADPCAKWIGRRIVEVMGAMQLNTEAA